MKDPLCKILQRVQHTTQSKWSTHAVGSADDINVKKDANSQSGGLGSFNTYVDKMRWVGGQ